MRPLSKGQPRRARARGIHSQEGAALEESVDMHGQPSHSSLTTLPPCSFRTILAEISRPFVPTDGRGGARRSRRKETIMTSRRTRLIAPGVLALMSVASTPVLAAEAPAGQMTWALHFSLAPTLFEPAETAGLITPFMILYALHDALVKPMPEKTMAPSLAESWSTSPDGLVYEFVLRHGAMFQNGEPVTPADVKFSFERYRGISAKVLKEKVAAIDTPDPRRVRFR